MKRKVCALFMAAAMLMLLLSSCKKEPVSEEVSSSAPSSAGEPEESSSRAPIPSQPPKVVEPIPVPIAEVGIYAPAGDVKAVSLAVPTRTKLPKWRGANFLNFFIKGQSTGYGDNGREFNEADFALMQKLGFNFIRLAMDYRYFVPGDYDTVDMAMIGRLDTAVEYAIKYNIHLQLCFHSCPGKTAGKTDGMNLFQNTANKDTPTRYPQDLAAAYWGMMAKRYKDIPNNIMSFNLFNEPSDSVTDQQYLAATNKMLAAIEKESPGRFIILDGAWDNTRVLPISYATKPNIASSIHIYQPTALCTLGESGKKMPDGFTSPVTWPMTNYLNGTIFAPYKANLYFKGTMNTVITNKNGFAAGGVTIRLVEQSSSNTATILADGVNVGTIAMSGSVAGGKDFHSDGNIIPAGTKKVEVFLSSGDWVTFDSITISGVKTLATASSWMGYPGAPVEVTESRKTDHNFFHETVLTPWADFKKQHGTDYMAGEWGISSSVPHTARIEYIKDLMKALGDQPWAVWEFKGGIYAFINQSGTGMAGVETVDMPITVDGKTTTYKISKDMYNAVKPYLDNPCDLG